MPAKFDRCVKAVRGKSRGRVNAYAVCTAAGTRTNNPPQRYNSDPFDGFDEKSFEESQEGRFGNLRGFSKRVGRGFPVTVLQKVRTRSLVRVDHFGEPRYGWLNNEEIVTEQKFLKRFRYPPEGKPGVKSNPESDSASMYESFHGSPSEEVIEFHDQEHYHGNLAGLGVLVELKLCTITGYDVTLSFSDPEALVAANPGVWERLKGIGSRSTVYSVPKHVEKMVKTGSVKGHEIFKAAKGDFRVPTLERESSFDSLADAKRFIGEWVKANGEKKKVVGPFQSSSRLIGQAGAYLDNQLGRALNPGSYSVSSVNKKPTYHRTVAAAKKEAAKRKGEGDSEVIVSVKTTSGGQYTTVQNPGTSQDPALLCSNEAGTQLYIQGGDQGVDLKAIHMADVPVKDSMVLGEAYFVSYFTTKDFDQHKPTIYEHELSEESDKRRKYLGQGSGLYPTVRYDTLNKKLYLDGGSYFIKKPLLSTSPGIQD